MRKYIDAGKMLEEYKHSIYDTTDLAEMLNYMPAADVVEVVRCKDCTMYKRDKELAEANYCDPNFYCGLLRTEMDEDGYCSYGRRKGE